MNSRFILEMIDYENDLEFKNVEKAADVLGIPLFEHVFMPHLNEDSKYPIATSTPVLVGYLNIKRMQQLLHKKNGLALDDTKRDIKTNQVIHKEKQARSSDVEATLLVAMGATNVLKELHGPRADDSHMALQMKEAINMGYVDLESLESDPHNKVTLNTINTYLLSMGIKSDLLTSEYVYKRA